MANEYQPKVPDRNRKIRKTVESVRKKTRVDKSVIVERILLFGIEHIGEIFPEFDKNQGA